MSWRLGGTADHPVWEVADAVDFDAHVVDHTEAVVLDRSRLEAAVAQLFTTPLDRSRPLWQIDVLGPLNDGSSALVWRIHHALADGTATMRYASAVLWDEIHPPTVGASRARAAVAPTSGLRHVAGFVAREFGHSLHHSVFDGVIGSQRSVAWCSVPLADLRRTSALVEQATVNDAVLASVAGGLRRWIEAHLGRLGPVRVKVPVSLHHEGDGIGNRDSFFCVTLPVDEADPIRRLARIRKETVLRKREHDAQAMDGLLVALARASPRLRAWCERIQAGPRAFALNVSNVPGPRTPVEVTGHAVRALYDIADIRERHALRVAVVSLADMLSFGLCADPAIVDDVALLASGIEAEARELAALAG
jgi:hypothetical protein